MTTTLQKKGSLLLIQGLDVSAPAEYISDQSSPNCQNFLVSRGLLSKRPGSLAHGLTMNEEVMAGTEFEREGVKYNIRIGPTKIQKDSNGTWTDIGHTDFTGGTDDIFDVATTLLAGKQILVVTNGVDAIRKWTASGNTAVLGGSPPRAKYFQEYKGYLVLANIQGGIDIDTRVQWPDTNSPEDWSSGNAGSNDLEEDGGAITGLNLFSNYLAVHKEKSIYLGYLVNTNSVFKFDRKATGAGTIANNSICNLPTGEQIFLASDGLRIFNGITANLIDSPINDEIRESLNNEKRHKAWSVLVKEQDEVWIGIPFGSDEFGSTIYKFNYVKRVLYKDYRLEASSGWRSTQSAGITWDEDVGTWDEDTKRWNASSSAGNFPLVYIGYDDGRSLYLNGLTRDDDGEAIRAFWESKDYEDDEKRLARWLQMEIWAKGQSVKVEYSIDEGLTWVEVYGSPFTLSDSFPSDISPVIAYFDALSSKFRIRFSNDEIGETLDIKQFIIGYKPREFRR